MENTSGTNRSGELFSFPSGSHFPASPWTGAKMMFLIFCFQALQLWCPWGFLPACDPAVSLRRGSAVHLAGSQPGADMLSLNGLNLAGGWCAADIFEMSAWKSMYRNKWAGTICRQTCYPRACGVAVCSCMLLAPIPCQICSAFAWRFEHQFCGPGKSDSQCCDVMGQYCYLEAC